jgi:inorganic pyrophosphatase
MTASMDDPDGAVEAVIEIPKGTRNKYEYHHERGVIFLDRRLFSATYYPADYGFLPGTLAEDGDPLDVLVILDEPTFPGCHIMVRPVGVFWMSDEHGRDAKIIAVPDHDAPSGGVSNLDELAPHLTDEIEHFFKVYKDLEPSKHSDVFGFGDAGEAETEIRRSVERAATRHPGD